MRKIFVKDLYELPNLQTGNNIVQFMHCKTFYEKYRYTKIFIEGFGKKKNFILELFSNFLCFSLMYLIKYNNEDVGCFLLKKCDLDFLFLYDFTILKEYRNKGLGQNSLEHIFSLCKDLRYDYLCLFIEDGNKVAENLYLKNGFLPENEFINYIVEKKGEL